MKAVLYDAPRSFAVTDIPKPEVGPGEVRIRVEQVGVCGTDLHIHNGDFNAVFPLIPGHELVGVVDAARRRRRPGSRSASRSSVNPNIYCGACDYCLSGRLILCANLQGLGSNFPGFFAEYVTVPAEPGLLGRGLPPTPPSSPSPPPAPCTGWRPSTSARAPARWSSAPDRPACCWPSSSPPAAHPR